LKCVNPAKAPTTVYKDHLPLLGMHYHRNEVRKPGVSQNFTFQQNQLQYQLLVIGDRVSFSFLVLNDKNINKLNNMYLLGKS